MKYITKITISINQKIAKDLINFYNIKKESLSNENLYFEKSIEMWKKNNDQQMVAYYEKDLNKNKTKIETENRKIKFLEEESNKKPDNFNFDILGKEFMDFKQEYLHSLHVKYNDKYEDPKRKARSGSQMMLQDFQNREYFDKELPNNAFIPYCATDIYCENVPEKLIQKIVSVENLDTANCLLNEENTKKAIEAIKKDEKMEEAKQALIRKEEKQPKDKIKIK